MGSKTPPELLWVPYTGQRDKSSLKIVRKHVMHNFVDKHNGDPRRHFTRDSIDHSSHSRNTYRGSVASTTSQTSTESNGSAQPTPPFQHLCTAFAVQKVNVEEPQPYPWCLFNSRFKLDKLEPFDAFPATIDKTELIWWHTYQPGNGVSQTNIPWLRALNRLYLDSLWDASKDHKGLFHLMLCIGQARRSIVTGVHDEDTNMAHHTQAISFAREKLNACEIDDLLLMTMCSLARVNLADEQIGLAIKSLEAVQEVFNNFNAGMLERRSIQWRVIAWTDLRLASTLLAHPYLRYRELENTRLKLPIEVRSEASSRNFTTMEMIPPFMPEGTRKLFHALHIATGIYDTRKSHVQPQKEVLWAMQDVSYHTLYRLCALVADANGRAFTVPAAVLLAMRLYAWACVPEYIPEQAQVKVCYEPFMKRVSAQALSKLSRELYNVGPIGYWWRAQGGGRLECLLWIIFVAWSIAKIDCKNQRHQRMPPFDAANWFLVQLREVSLELRLQDEKALEVELRKFPWVDHFCLKNCREAWLRMGISSLGLPYNW